jgi:ribonuclease P protein component
MNERIERNKIKRKIREDICMLAFRKTIEEFNKMTSCKVDHIIAVREQIDQIVFEETLKDFINIFQVLLQFIIEKHQCTI